MTSGISTSPKTAVGTYVHAEDITTFTLAFLPTDEEASSLLLPSSVPLLSGSRDQPENKYLCILSVIGQG